MDRNRDSRRVSSMAAPNGLSRRRHRTSSLRDSPEEDGGGGLELQESGGGRLRERGGGGGGGKKDRDRLSRSSKRRRGGGGGGDRLIHGNSNREEGGGGGGGEESTEESLDDDDEEDEETTPPTTTTSTSDFIRMHPPPVSNTASSSSMSNHHHNHQIHHQRKSFPPTRTVPWKVSDEMGFSVPKKARTASAKRSPQEYWVSGGSGGGGGGEMIHRQASTSPARPATTPSPLSPSSSNASARKKMKPIGPKHKPPKISKPSSSPAQEEIEIEIAEVLYGLMRQPQCPSRQEVLGNSSQKLDSRDTTNGSVHDLKSSSRVSSPPSSMAAHQPNSSSTSTPPLAAVAPKRKRPRPVKSEEEKPATSSAVRNDSVSAASARIEMEHHQSAKTDVSSLKLEKNPVENGGSSLNLGSSEAQAILPTETQRGSTKEENNTIISDSKLLTVESEAMVQKEAMASSPKKESLPSSTVRSDVDHHEKSTTTKSLSTALDVESNRLEKLTIDLMAPPMKSSPDRDGINDFVSASKRSVPEAEMLKKTESVLKDEQHILEKIGKRDEVAAIGVVEKETEARLGDFGSNHTINGIQTMLDLQINLERQNKDTSTSSSVNGSKQPQKLLHQHQHQQTKPSRNEPKLEKAAQPSSLPPPMAAPPGWSGGIPPLGYGLNQVRPIPGVAPLDANAGPTSAMQPPHFLLSQPRPKRCATHYYIARNIYYYQQMARMNSTFWPATAAGSSSLYGAKSYNLNMVPPTETTIVGNQLQGSFNGRSMDSVPEKAQVEASFSGKDKSIATINLMDSSQRKQHVLQQASQPATAAPTNLMHGPALIFPLGQQQVASVAAAASRAGAVKSAVATDDAASSIAANSGPGTSSSATASTATVSFSYPNMPNMPLNEAQYMAILQNNGYPFPIPPHIGAPPPYRGSHPPGMPFFNGSFYSSQMIHPSQLQHQHQQQQQQQQHQHHQHQHQHQPQLQQQQQPHSQPLPVQQGHQNTSTSSGSSSSLKQQQNQRHQQHGGGSNGGGGSSQSFSASKNRPQQQLQQQQQQQQQQQNHSMALPKQTGHVESEMGTEENPSTADSQVSHSHKNVYGQNIGMPMLPKNFTLMSPAQLVAGGSASHGQQQQQQQHPQSLKGPMEIIPSQALAMSIASFNGAATASGLDFSSMAQNHAIFHNFSDAARHSYQMATAAAQAALQKKAHQMSEEGKTVGDSNNGDDERKSRAGKGPTSSGQSLVFSRPESTDLVNNVVDSSARTVNLISSRSNAATTMAASAAPTAANTQNSQQQHHQQQLIQLQKQHQQQQQMQQQRQQIQHHQQQQMQQQQQQMQQHQQQLQQQYIAAATRNKTSTTSSTDVYPSSSITSKFPNPLSMFPQALMHQGGSPAQSPQWKNSTRSTASPPVGSSSSSLKNLPQQQGRSQQGQTQISFGGNQKQGTTSHGQQPPANNQNPSSPVVGSPPPTSSSRSAGGGGSPRTSSTGNKVGPAPPSLSSQQQQPKNSSSGANKKSSPVGGRNVPSILGNSHLTPSTSSATKFQAQQQQQHQHQHQHQQQHQHQHQQQQQQHQQHQHQHQQQLQQQLQKQSQKQAQVQQSQLMFSNAFMQGQSMQSSSNNSPTTAASTSVGYYHQQRRQSEQQQQQQQQQQQGSSNMGSNGVSTSSPSRTLAGATTTSDPAKAVAAAAAAAAAAASNNQKGGLPPGGLIHAAQFAAQQAGGNAHHQFMSAAAFPYMHAVPTVHQVKPAEQKQPAGNDNLHASWQPEKR